MSRSSLDDPSIAFLERLLSRSERNPDRQRAASAAPNYSELHTADLVARFKERMLAAERAGAVTVTPGKRERRHLIDRITVKDYEALAHHLGRTPARLVASQTVSSLRRIVADGPDWVSDILSEIETRWSRGESAFRIPATDEKVASEFLVLLRAIALDQARGLDARTFSLKATGDTKAFDRHSSRLASVLTARFNGEAKADLVWRHVGLERFPHPVHVKGFVIVEDGAGVIIHGRAKPFVSIHPDMLPQLELFDQPAAILTIENFASFNRYVREIDDNTLVIYTGGFASVGCVELLNALLSKAHDAPFFHWGDIDPGGLRIFRFLEENLSRPPAPHLMARDLAETYGRAASADKSLSALSRSNSAIADLASWLANGEAIKHLEQEALPLTSPIK